MENNCSFMLKTDHKKQVNSKHSGLTGNANTEDKYLPVRSNFPPVVLIKTLHPDFKISP